MVMGQYFYKAIIEPAEQGGFFAYVPKLPGCVSQGETYEECLANIKEATELYLETARARENRIIQDDTHVTELCISL
jgi:predicted RNase H-like HicB family nuclease